MKRSHTVDDQAGAEEDSDAEMDVDQEEKLEPPEREDDQEQQENPFLDSFYGIASNDPAERAQAGQILLTHCLIGPQANVKDADYALKRLLRGVCSGRAAARQGNAATLASFLKVAVRLSKLSEIKAEHPEAADMSDLAFVRERLVSTTKAGPVQGRRKGSEERDYHFGKLFGINGIIRSGVLLPSDDTGMEDLSQVCNLLLSDLIMLYGYKNWIREPAAHAICTMLMFFYDRTSDNDGAKRIVDSLVTDTLIPEFFGDASLKSMTPEQVAVAAVVQANASSQNDGNFAAPLDSAVFSTSSIPVLAPTLSQTSSVALPRTHLVWDAMCFFLFQSTSSAGKSQSMTAKESCPVSGERVEDVVEAVLRHIIVEQLLGLESEESGAGKTTHERRALAICIVRQFAGVEFVSSLTGRARIQVGAEFLEWSVFSALLVKRLFLDVILAGTGRSKNQAAHMLKPLASQTLVEIAASVRGDGRRNAVARALLRCESRFDARTKSATVTSLLSDMNDNQAADRDLTWFRSFLESEFLSSAQDQSSGNKYLGYLDLLYQHAKETASKADQEEAFDRVLALLAAVAFFDCSKANRKGPESSPFSLAISAIRKAHSSPKKSPFPFDIRVKCSARFFSLVTEKVLLINHSPVPNKDVAILSFLLEKRAWFYKFVEHGASPIKVKSESTTDDVEEEQPEAVIDQLKALSDSSRPESKRCATGCGILATVLSLQLLFSCGDPDQMEDDPADDEEEEEVGDLLVELKEIAAVFSDKDDSEDNPLQQLAGACATILSSSLALGGASLGAFPTLLRSGVKFAWSGGLLSSVDSSVSSLDSAVVDVVLNAIGVVDDSPDDDEEIGEEMDDSDEEGSQDHESGSDVDDNVFGNASGTLDFDADMEKADRESEPPEEMEIDDTKLQSLLEAELEDGIDAGELEHHEGADGALAKMIQLQKDARKAGQVARERFELARQSRCVFLLETIVTGKPEGWGKLVKVDYILQAIIPILKYRKELVRSVAKTADKGSTSSVSEKRAMIERLTSLLKNKILKMKLPGSPWSVDDVSSEATSMATELHRLAGQTTDKEQQLLCNSSLMFLLRNLPSVQLMIEIAELYGPVLSEWTTKRSSKIEATFFENVISQHPVVAQVGLISALTTSTKDARSPFLKSECFRFLSMVYNPKINAGGTELEKAGIQRARDCLDASVKAVVTAIGDAEMKKAKRAREVLRFADRVVAFATGKMSRVLSVSFSELSDVLEKLKESSESAGISSACSNLGESIQNLLKEELVDPEPEAGSDASPNKKKKKQKGKKKKKKR